MKPIIAILLAAAAIQVSCQEAPEHGAAEIPAGPAEVAQPGSLASAYFDWFDYAGADTLFETALEPGQFRNPILAGYYPDPSVVVVEDDYYMVNSTFGFYPGIPVFHSRDLINWTQLGNAVDRPDMMPFDGLNLGNHGVYAATIEHHDGIFYIMNTCVNCGGNFVLTATDPAGPWSDPIWLPHIPGIDPSLFIDDDGAFYVVHHANPAEPDYPGHTLINIIEVDPESFEARSEDVTLVDGAEETPWNTIYIEGPHVYKVDDRYILSAPGGGTGYHHQQLAFEADGVFGPYTAYPGNPILTQHGLPDDRANPVTATGHADIFQAANGEWWAVFLATRVYDLETPPRDPGNFQTGRETFLLPVTWIDGWPIILERGAPLPLILDRPDLPDAGPVPRQMTGNYARREQFDGELGPEWLFIRTPHETWWSSGEGVLTLPARPERIGDRGQPSFVGQRLAHMRAQITTQMRFTPAHEGEEAGLLALQNDAFYYAFGLGRNARGEAVLRIRRRAGTDEFARGETLAETIVDLADGAMVRLRLAFDQDRLDFSYSLDDDTYVSLLDGADASLLGSMRAGGFTGAVIGMYAEAGPTE